MVAYGDQGYTGYFPNSSLQILIICADHVASVLLDSVDDAVVGIRSLMSAAEAFESGVFCQF